MQLPLTLAEWPRNGNEIVRVCLDSYKGCVTIEARVWYATPEGYKPSRNGLTLASRHVAKLSEALALARQQAAALGLDAGGEQ